MQSRLLNTLLTQSKTTSDRVVWARAVCRAAGHMARAGHVDPALESIARVRTEFGPGLHPSVASWLMLAEGILHWSRFEVKQAYDRIMRAHALSIAFRLQRAQASSAAWMALIEFNQGQYDKMVEHLNQAFTLAEPDDHQARARATLVLADAYHATGDFNLAKPWYEQARRHATAEGDEATIGAMLYNVAVSRIACLRIADAFGEVDAWEAKRASLEAGGSATFDHITNNPTQESWRFLMKARQLVIERSFAEAIAQFEKVQRPLMDFEKVEPAIFTDKAWCLLKLGRTEEAEAIGSEAEAKVHLITDADDRAYVYKRLAEIAGAFGRTEAASLYLRAAEVAHLELVTFQRELLDKLRSIQSSATQ